METEALVDMVSDTLTEAEAETLNDTWAMWRPRRVHTLGHTLLKGIPRHFAAHWFMSSSWYWSTPWLTL